MSDVAAKNAEAFRRLMQREVDEKAERANMRYFSPRGKHPAFCWTTEKVKVESSPLKEGWASYVMAGHGSDEQPREVEGASYELHRTRKAAKARAWNLCQGYRLAKGLRVTWRTFA